VLRPRELVNRVREVQQLYRTWQQNPGEQVYRTLVAIRQCDKHLQEHFGLRLEGLEILEVAPGPRLQHLRALSVKNPVTGIDRNVVPQGFHLRDYLELFLQAPPAQAAKTVTRQLLGRDSHCEKALANLFSVQRFPRLPVFRMDPARMTFSDASFDLVCSWTAFEHLDSPWRALSEVARVLRPGGVAYLVTHLHEAWRQLFQETMPGVCFLHEEETRLTGASIALWRKPPPV
jgi:hypothetical protein